MEASVAQKQWFGHPRGLATLFFTEMWERYSYYGMRALLTLYMVGSVQQPGLGFDEKRAADIYGWYTFSAWGLSIGGGFIADRWLGHYRSVLVGGIIIALGHFSMAVPSLPFFFAGLVLIATGTGLLKPNASTMVGSLYRKDDERRDAGFSLFYTGINLGAFFGPIITGYLGQKINWHIGFGAAGVGMVFGLIQYVAGKKYLVPAEPEKRIVEEHPEAATKTPLSRADWTRLTVIFILFCFSIVFWAGYEQAGTSLTLFADRATRLTAFGWEFPSTWFQSVAPLCVWTFAPLFAALWLFLARRNHDPSSPMKMMFGLMFLSLSYILIFQAAKLFEGANMRVSPWWLVGMYALQTFGEICLYPTGMSMVTKLAPARFVGVIMGVWFLSIAFGNKAAGWVAGFLKDMTFSQVFWIAFITSGIAAILLLILVRPIRKLMGDVH